jgi:hypothetical protein
VGAGVLELPGGATACLFQREDEAVAVLWARTKSSARQVELTGLPVGSRALDVMGNPITEGRAPRFELTKAPAYVVVPRGLAADLREAVQAALVAP